MEREKTFVADMIVCLRNTRMTSSRSISSAARLLQSKGPTGKMPLKGPAASSFNANKPGRAAASVNAKLPKAALPSTKDAPLLVRDYNLVRKGKYCRFALL